MGITLKNWALSHWEMMSSVFSSIKRAFIICPIGKTVSLLFKLLAILLIANLLN